MMAHSVFQSVVLSLFVFMMCLTAGCSSPPSLGDDPRAAKLADALMTAFAAKRIDLVDQGAKELDRLDQEKVVSAEVVQSFRHMISSAQQGDWSGASSSIKAFIRGQRK